MYIKKWVGVVIVVGFLGVAFVWIKGQSQIPGQDMPATYKSSSVPVPGPGQKKVVFKNLGMT